MARSAAKGDKHTAQPVWGQGFGPAAELPLGAELYVTADSTGNLIAGDPANRVFDRVTMALRATKANEDAARDSTKPVAPAIFRRCSSPVRTASSTERTLQYSTKIPWQRTGVE